MSEDFIQYDESIASHRMCFHRVVYVNSSVLIETSGEIKLNLIDTRTFVDKRVSFLLTLRRGQRR